MKQLLLSFLFLILFISVYGQVEFKEGYYLNNENKKIEGFIKDEDWKNNPDHFIFKKHESDQPQGINIESAQEFKIYNSVKFKRSEVLVDRSPDHIDRLNYDKNPDWSKETLYLKVLLEGQASLYFFEDKSLKRYFFDTPDTPVKQLINKRYKTESNQMATNAAFRQQLWMELACKETNIETLKNLKYVKSELLRHFKKYNECVGAIYEIHKLNERKDLLAFRATPGLNYSSLSLENPRNSTTGPPRYIEFDREFGFRLGLEAEIILPFQNNKWAVVFEPTFQYFNSTATQEMERAVCRYNAIELPAGLRHSLFLNNDLKFFLNAFYIPSSSLNFKSYMESERFSKYNSGTVGYRHLKIGGDVSFAIGGGMAFNNLSAEVRYYPNREILAKYNYWSTEYSRLSLILGYRFYHIKN